MNAPEFKIGDIFVSSWGWEQTNVEAFKVVAKTKHFATLAPIKVKMLETTGWASADVIPDVESEPDMNNTIRKKVSKSGWIKLSSFSSAYKWDGKRKYYMSWYG